MPIEPGDSWFSPKSLEGEPRRASAGGRAPIGQGALTGYRVHSNSEYQAMRRGSQTAGDKLRRQEGNSPDRQLRSRNRTKWERESPRKDNQDVGSEAATIQRVRNSSLVEWGGTENVTGLKSDTEAADRARARW